MNVTCVVCGVPVEACCSICGDPVCDKHALGHDLDAHGLRPEDPTPVEARDMEVVED